MSRKHPHLCLVYAGGTLGMVRSARGYRLTGDFAGLLRARLPELSDPGMPTTDLVMLDPAIDSSNATPASWRAIAGAIRTRQEAFDGFVVIHGTDTLAYTSSALSFLLAGIRVPVIVTGSQIPLSEPRNDAHGNLLAAITIAGESRVPGVSVAFGRRLMRGNRVAKTSAQALDAFTSPNYPVLAEIGTRITLHPTAGEDWPDPAAWLGRADEQERRVAAVPLSPGMGPEVLDLMREAAIGGVVLECYGMGNVPDEDPGFMAALERLVRSGTAVTAISQCREGSVALGTYASGRALVDLGVISGFDMTREAALTKLHTLLARGYSGDALRALMEDSLRGELTRPGD